MMATRDKKEKINRFIPLLLFLKSLFTNSENKNVKKFSHDPPPPGRIPVSAPDTFEWHIGTVSICTS